MTGLRREVRSWLEANWSGRPTGDWLAQVVDARFAVPSWPEQWYGRSADRADAAIIEEEFAAASAPGAGQDRLNLWANTVLTFGSDEVKERFIRPLLLDEIGMCLLYSEPGAGSDLAGLATTAALDGDEWVVSGQKVWSSGAQVADYAFLLARTDWDAPKHQGISFLLLPMRQAGVEVRPIRQATGDERFNEVFLDEARLPAGYVLGPLNGGWRVLQTALFYERALMGVNEGSPESDQRASADPRAAAWAIPPPDLDLVELARSRGRSGDPSVRQQLAAVYTLRTVKRWNTERGQAAEAQGSTSPVASLGKLAMSQLLHYAAKVEMGILGAESTLEGKEFPRAADANYSQLNAYFTSIGGGTDQIQRNIIAERILGLPRDPDPERDVPFRTARQRVAANSADGR